MTPSAKYDGTDPRHVFLTRKETFMRYRKERTAGYLFLQQPGFPPAVGDCYRLDMLMRWEDGERWPTNGWAGTAPAPATEAPVDAAPAPQLPASRRGRRDVA